MQGLIKVDLKFQISNWGWALRTEYEKLQSLMGSTQSSNIVWDTQILSSALVNWKMVILGKKGEMKDMY